MAVMPAGAALTSSAGTNSQSVSEHLLASLLALYRKLPLCRDRQREHKWDQDIGQVRTLVGATVLVAGAGHVAPPSPSCARPWGRRTIGLKRTVNIPVPGFDLSCSPCLSWTACCPRPMWWPSPCPTPRRPMA